jgi:predicted nucleotidyltransferase
MFNHERYLAVGQRTRDALDRILAGVDTTSLRCVILFGSQAKGMARRSSDIDLCFVWRDGNWPEDIRSQVRELAFPHILVDPHFYSQEDFKAVPDLVVLDAILFGISLHDDRYLLSIRSDLDTIGKEALLARLDSSRRLLEEASSVVGEVRKHLEIMAEVGLTEVESVLHDGVTLARAEVAAEGDLEVRIERLSKELALEGERIRLT